MIVDKINKYLSNPTKIKPNILENVANLARYSFDRQFGEQKADKHTLRLSAIGKCLRQLAYGELGFEPNGKTIDSRGKMVFFQGDIVELALTQLAVQAGCEIHYFGQEQKKVFVEGVAGSPDGIYTDETGKKHILEVKSMTSYGFKSFEQGELDQSYMYQTQAYQLAEGLDSTIFLALNKDAGVIGERIIAGNPGIKQDIVNRIKLLKTIKKDELPERPYQPNDKGFYPWNCLYCQFYKTCLPDAELVLVGNANKLKAKKCAK